MKKTSLQKAGSVEKPNFDKLTGRPKTLNAFMKHPQNAFHNLFALSVLLMLAGSVTADWFSDIKAGENSLNGGSMLAFISPTTPAQVAVERQCAVTDGHTGVSNCNPCSTNEFIGVCYDVMSEGSGVKGCDYNPWSSCGRSCTCVPNEVKNLANFLSAVAGAPVSCNSGNCLLSGSSSGTFPCCQGCTKLVGTCPAYTGGGTTPTTPTTQPTTKVPTGGQLTCGGYPPGSTVCLSGNGAVYGCNGNTGSFQISQTCTGSTCKQLGNTATCTSSATVQQQPGVCNICFRSVNDASVTKTVWGSYSLKFATFTLTGDSTAAYACKIVNCGSTYGGAYLSNAAGAIITIKSIDSSPGASLIGNSISAVTTAANPNAFITAHVNEPLGVPSSDLGNEQCSATMLSFVSQIGWGQNCKDDPNCQGKTGQVCTNGVEYTCISQGTTNGRVLISTGSDINGCTEAGQSAAVGKGTFGAVKVSKTTVALGEELVVSPQFTVTTPGVFLFTADMGPDQIRTLSAVDILGNACGDSGETNFVSMQTYIGSPGVYTLNFHLKPVNDGPFPSKPGTYSVFITSKSDPSQCASKEAAFVESPLVTVTATSTTPPVVVNEQNSRLKACASLELGGDCAYSSCMVLATVQSCYQVGGPESACNKDGYLQFSDMTYSQALAKFSGLSNTCRDLSTKGECTSIESGGASVLSCSPVTTGGTIHKDLVNPGITKEQCDAKGGVLKVNSITGANYCAIENNLDGGVDDGADAGADEGADPVKKVCTSTCLVANQSNCITTSQMGTCVKDADGCLTLYPRTCKTGSACTGGVCETDEVIKITPKVTIPTTSADCKAKGGTWAAGACTMPPVTEKTFLQKYWMPILAFLVVVGLGVGATVLQTGKRIRRRM